VNVTPVGGTGAALTVANNPTTVGAADTLTFSIPVNAGAPAPAGTITFTGGGVNLGTATWPANATPANGFYTITISPTTIPLGNPTQLTATFAPTAGSGYGASAPTASVTVTQIPGTGDTLTANPNPSVFGNPVVFTETVPTVNGITPTGTVTFFYNGTQIGTGTLTNGVVTATTSTLPVGSDPVTATYSGDANYAPVTDNVTQVVGPATAQATLAAGPNPATFGQTVTLTETLVPINGVCPPGPVTFFNNGTQIGTPATVNAQCVATITTNTLPVGSDAITATAPASGSFAAVTSGPVALVINKANGADTLASSPNPSTFGSNVTITDTIPTVAGVAPTGTVNFYDFGTLIGTGTVNAAGVATLVTATLPVGTDSLTAIYQGDGNYAQVTAGPVNQVVSPVSTTPTLTVGPNPTTFGTPVTVTETIPVVNGTPATGTVIFSQNGTVIGTGTINAQGIASFTTSTLPVGNDPITATYGGDTNYASISSGPVTEVINKANGADTLVVSPDPANFGSTVTITDTVPTVGGVAPTGTVTFTNNGTVIGTAPIVNGVATLTTTTLPVGSDPISAAYGGDNNYAPVTTGPVNEVVVVTGTTPVLGATPNPTTFGTPVTLTESIPGINGVTPTGTVQFFDNGTLIGTGTVNAQGVATLVTSTLPIGTDQITAKYSGDTNYAAGTTGPLNVVINKAAPVDTLTSAPTPTTFGTQVTETFTVPLINGVVPTGLVSFYNGTTLIGTANVNASGVATITTSTLPVGTDTITAKYPGDNTYAPASPTATEVVGLATGTGDTLSTNPNPSTFGQSVTITETLPTVGGVAPTGTVTFYNNGAQIGTGTVTNGVATLNISTLPAGSDLITATYSGDGNYATVNSGPVTQVVNNTNGTSNLTANPNPGTFGVPVTLTEKITPINGLCPNGPATFLNGGVAIGTGAISLTGGQCVATLTTSTLPVGTNTITATVPASNGFGPTNSGPLSLVINKAPGTGDTLSTNPNPSTFGQTVTLTEVLPTVNGAAPTGTVVFTYNGTTIGTGTVANGIATATTSTLPAGSDPITATYSGDANYATVTSGPVVQVVNAGSTSATLAVGPNPSTFGTPVTLTETIAPINGSCPVGPATFLNNGASIGTGVIALTNGACIATLTTSTLPVGTDSLTATVPGNGSFSPITSGPVALVVNKANGADTLATNPNPSTFGTNVTITDTIPTVGGVAPTGTVNFYDFGTLIGTGTVTNGVATLVTGTLPVGTDSITATYLGDANYAQVITAPVNQVVTPVPTTATLAAGPNPTTFGTQVTITETIPVVNGTPATGIVTFLSNGNVIGTGTINAQGVASITSTTLPVGTDPITATYPGNTNYTAVNSGPVNEIVNKANGPNTLTVNPDPAPFGAPVTLTDTIPTVGGVAPTGTVNFYNNGTLIGTGTVTNGVATLVTSTLPVGSDPITAVYSGDPNYTTITTGPVNEIVTAGNTTPVLGATPNPSTFGTTVTVTEAIPGINGVLPTGSVTFSYTPPGSTTPVVIGTGTVKNGVATVTTNTLPIGTDPVTAVYTGDTNYSTANSGPLNVVVTQATPNDTLTSSPTAPTFGSPVTLTFTVPLVNGVVPTGVVTFYNGTTILGTGTINSSGVATITTSTLPAGTTTVTAKYPGDGTYAPASPSTTVTVGPAAPVVTISTNVPVTSIPACGTSVTLTATITLINGTPVSGTVQFYNFGVALGAPVPVTAGGTATLTTTALPCGTTNSITAVFTPTPAAPYAPSNAGPIALPVAAPDFVITASPANQVVNPGDSATYTVSLSGLTVPFTSPVTLTATCNCQGITISFANPVVTPGQGPTNTTMTIVTSPTFAMSKPARGTNNVFYGLLLLPLLGLGGVRRKLRKLPKGISYCLAALLLLGGMGAVTGCGGGYYGPPVKVCTITITGTSGTITHSTTVNVTVR
jgi:predicted thioesterase